MRVVRYVRLTHPRTGLAHLAYASGEDYQAHAHNEAVMERAIEALAIQRDHYAGCIREYNAGE